MKAVSVEKYGRDKTLKGQKGTALEDRERLWRREDDLDKIQVCSLKQCTTTGKNQSEASSQPNRATF